MPNMDSINKLRRLAEDARDNGEKAMIPPGVLDHLLDIASHALTHIDPMDGGITAARVEQETNR